MVVNRLGRGIWPPTDGTVLSHIGLSFTITRNLKIGAISNAIEVGKHNISSLVNQLVCNRTNQPNATQYICSSSEGCIIDKADENQKPIFLSVLNVFNKKERKRIVDCWPNFLWPSVGVSLGTGKAY